MSLTELRLACLASPARARSLLTVRAAISSAVSSDSPRFFSPLLMCSYWRSRLAFHAFCGIWTSLQLESVVVIANYPTTVRPKRRFTLVAEVAGQLLVEDDG